MALCDLSLLVTRYHLEDVNRAMTEMASGAVMKAVLVPDGAD
jgi:Zn-dependent alcohol dehydrogenase